MHSRTRSKPKISDLRHVLANLCTKDNHLSVLCTGGQRPPLIGLTVNKADYLREGVMKVAVGLRCQSHQDTA